MTITLAKKINADISINYGLLHERVKNNSTVSIFSKKNYFITSSLLIDTKRYLQGGTM